MDVHCIATSDEFLEVSRDFRASEPYLTNVIGSVALSVSQGRRYDSCHWWVVTDHSNVVGIAMRTMPWNLMISPMPREAHQVMAAAVADVFPDLPGMSGPLADADVYQSALNAVSAEPSMAECVYVLKSFAPASAAGASRRTTVADLPLLRTWLEAFAIEARLPTHDIEAGAKRMLDVGFFWDCDGETVAMCGYAGPVGDEGAAVGRIGPVYTAPEHRKRGFGAAVTSAAIAHLQTRCDHIMLYADADNPTSNGVYQRLGFVEYAQTGQVQFAY